MFRYVAFLAIFVAVQAFESPFGSILSIRLRNSLINSATMAILTTALSANAVEVSKSDFIDKAAEGVSIERNLKNNLENAKEQERRDAKSAAPIEGVRLVDLGGSRGARALASNGLQGGSLVDQLKAYGGPGASEENTVKLVNGKSQRVDNSIKNPFKYKNEFEEQLKLYQKIGTQ